VGLADALMTSLKRKLTALELVPSDKGRFEVSIDGNLVYSKLATKEFPDDMAIVQMATKAAQ
jgi:selT/selW/selH-like putative selenoprotein